jgi:NitT/TauT family transport system ATP-binding protein
MIEIQDLSQTFTGRKGTVQALDGISLKVANNEFLAVIGRSGCGKSTLLRLIAGLLPASTGSVVVNGTEVRHPRRDISVMFQRPALLPWRSVLKNVLLPVEIFGWPVADYRQQAMELLESVGLADFAGRMPHELSGGMQQRVSLCRSLIQRPSVLLMDEPFSALDALTREELALGLAKVHAEHQSTVVFVTHSIDEAVLLADRVVVLSPSPGRVSDIVDIDIPRPRSLGADANIQRTAELRARLHELLMVPTPAA